jgi:hypothetical protein
MKRHKPVEVTDGAPANLQHGKLKSGGVPYGVFY